MARPFNILYYCELLFVRYKILGKKPHKVYLAIFCCFTTKAVHLEVVSDLTTQALLARSIYCDNATNFVGAENDLRKLKTAIYSVFDITKRCSQLGTEFHYIPPREPHFGGLWEAAVKSAKHLLVRTVSTADLTYEELETVIIDIEAILNSRPLIPFLPAHAICLH